MSLALALIGVDRRTAGIWLYFGTAKKGAEVEPKVILLTSGHIRLARSYYFPRQTSDDQGLDAFHSLGPYHQIPAEAYRPPQRADPGEADWGPVLVDSNHQRRYLGGCAQAGNLSAVGVVGFHIHLRTLVVLLRLALEEGLLGGMVVVDEIPSAEGH